ncbi:unnamed protein product [Adineta steineri]|uniref:DUF5648 domain-containing protein n=1 Tax=Adineta steineri TaxID=433720 RepID=A0A814XH58_9BILA|nr:unnamed protein product [Adineta steineri]CAF1216603.1 unnamed protein product [Adineta steineri]
MKVSHFLFSILLLNAYFYGWIHAQNVDLTSCISQQWIACGISVGTAIYKKYNSWSDIDEKQAFGTTCKSQFKSGFYDWEWVWSGKFWCPSLSATVMGESTKWKSRNGAIEHAIQDYVTKMTSVGLLKPPQLIDAPRGLVPFYRYSQNGYSHFYTIDPNEIGTVTPGSTGRGNYVFEGSVGRIYDSPGPNPSLTLALYRYINIRSGQHFYTTNWQEIGTNTVGASIGDWKHEGIAGYIYSTMQPDTRPLYRYYERSHDAHFYTPDANEIGTTTPGTAGRDGYVFEGIIGYVA